MYNVFTPGYVIETNQDLRSLLVTLRGPFLSEQSEKKLDDNDKLNRTLMRVWIEKWMLNNGTEDVTPENAINIQVS